MDELIQRPPSWASQKVEGRLARTGCGRGLFAIAPIARGEVLVVFGGTVVNRDELRVIRSTRSTLVIQVDDDAFLLSVVDGPADWVNHACKPNAGLRGQIVLVAMTPIAIGEEVTMDYATCDGCDYEEFECFCGSSNCRRRVTGKDWKIPELQQAYAGFFSPYLEARIQHSRRRKN